MAKLKCFALVVVDKEFKPEMNMQLSIDIGGEPPCKLVVRPTYIEADTIYDLKQKALAVFDRNLAFVTPEKPAWGSPPNKDFKPAAPVSIQCDSLCIEGGKPEQPRLEPVNQDLLNLEDLL